MENIKEDLFGNRYNNYTGKFHSRNDCIRALVLDSDSDFLAAMKLKSLEYYDEIAAQRREDFDRENKVRLKKIEESLEELKSGRIKKLFDRNKALSQQGSDLSNKTRMFEQLNKDLLLKVKTYDILFCELGFQNNSDSMKELILLNSEKEANLKKQNQEHFDKQWGFMEKHYKDLKAVYKDELDMVNRIAMTSSEEWAFLKAQKECKDLEVENGILNILFNYYEDMFRSKAPENFSIELLKDCETKAKILIEKEEAAKVAEKEEKEAIQRLKDEVARKEYEKKEKSRKFKSKAIWVVSIVAFLTIYNLVKPIKYTINNLVLFAPEYISQYAVTELLSGRNGYKEKYHETSLPGYRSVVYSTNYKDIIDNLKTIIPESDLTQVFKGCETKAIDCSQGIPFTVLVSLTKKNNTLPELTQKINSLIGKNIGLGLNPHYEFKEGKRGLYNLQRSSF